MDGPTAMQESTSSYWMLFYLLRIRSTVMSGFNRQVNGEKNRHTQLDFGAEDERGGCLLFLSDEDQEICEEQNLWQSRQVT